MTLVDTDGRGPDRITPRGVVVGEVEIPLDCLVFATGFSVGADSMLGSGVVVIGRDGISLVEKWSAEPASLHGIASNGFPNLFVLRAAQAAFTVNFPHLLDEQSRHVAYIVAEAAARDATVVEASREAEDEWVAAITARAGTSVTFHSTCTPGYFNNEGHADDRDSRTSFYGAGSAAYFGELARWRADGTLGGLELRSGQ